VEVVAILTSFIVGSTLCGVLFAGLAALGRRHATGNVMRWIDAFCGTALSFFGPRLLCTSTQRAFRWLSPALRAMS
jgi:threonine/homoserine/homoserine lactone efflux protein